MTTGAEGSAGAQERMTARRPRSGCRTPGEASLSSCCAVNDGSRDVRACVRSRHSSCRLEEGGIVTRCEITTYEPEGLLDLTFQDEDKVQRLIIKVRAQIY